jgi:hypothetical protein
LPGTSTGLEGSACRGGLSVAYDLSLCDRFEDAVFELPKCDPPEPPMLNRREKLSDFLWAVDPLLDVVDWDQRLRFPTPSLTPLKLLVRLYEVLERLLDSVDVTGFEKFDVPSETWFRILSSCGTASGRGVGRLGPIEAARWTVTIEEEGEELFLCWCKL